MGRGGRADGHKQTDQSLPELAPSWNLKISNKFGAIQTTQYV